MSPAIKLGQAAQEKESFLATSHKNIFCGIWLNLGTSIIFIV
jgi:hypothetical protein